VKEDEAFLTSTTFIAMALGRRPRGGERGLVIGAAAFATTRCVGAIVYIGASMYRELG